MKLEQSFEVSAPVEQVWSALIDIERVEVLRGPQSTLFGKSAIAGVLNIATQAPTTAERLASLRSLPKGFERSKWGEGILEAVKLGLARDPKSAPRLHRSSS